MSMIQSSWELLGSRSALRRGTARCRTVRSIAYRTQARASTARPIHSRRPALGWAVLSFCCNIVTSQLFSFCELDELGRPNSSVSRDQIEQSPRPQSGGARTAEASGTTVAAGGAITSGSKPFLSRPRRRRRPRSVHHSGLRAEAIQTEEWLLWSLRIGVPASQDGEEIPVE